MLIKVLFFTATGCSTHKYLLDLALGHECKLNWVEIYAEPQLQCCAAGHQHEAQAEVQAEVQEAPGRTRKNHL